MNTKRAGKAGASLQRKFKNDTSCQMAENGGGKNITLLEEVRTLGSQRRLRARGDGYRHLSLPPIG